MATTVSQKLLIHGSIRRNIKKPIHAWSVEGRHRQREERDHRASLLGDGDLRVDMSVPDHHHHQQSQASPATPDRPVE
jgi:hypothetical protein